MIRWGIPDHLTRVGANVTFAASVWLSLQYGLAKTTQRRTHAQLRGESGAPSMHAEASSQGGWGFPTIAAPKLPDRLPWGFCGDLAWKLCDGVQRAAHLAA